MQEVAFAMDMSSVPFGFARPEDVPPERLEEAHTIYRAIGRNIVLLQQMEPMLRFLAVNTNVSGLLADVKVEHQQRLITLKKAGLGNLVDEYSKRVLSPSQAGPVDDRHFNFSFKWMETDVSGKEIQLRMRRLARLRNQLVHNLPEPWIPGDATHFTALRDWLEQLSGELVIEWHVLKQQVVAVRSALELLKDQLTSDFFDLDQDGQKAWFVRRGIKLDLGPH